MSFMAVASDCAANARLGVQATAGRPHQKARAQAHGAGMGLRILGRPADNPGPIGPRIAVARGYHVLERASCRARLWRRPAPLENLPTFMTATHQPTTMLRTTGLTKRYGARVALGNLSLSLESGQFVALLGPNGAGKSTLFQVLTGLFAADEGEVEVAGHSLRPLGDRGAAPHRRRVPADVARPGPERSAATCCSRPICTACRAGWPARASRPAAPALGIDADLDRKVRELSGGNRRKVELVRATLHRPSVLLMDEATVGLDPKSRQDLLRALHADVRERGVCVLWATHLGRRGARRRPRAGAAQWHAARRRHACTGDASARRADAGGGFHRPHERRRGAETTQGDNAS